MEGDFFVVLTILTFFGNADSLIFIIECCLISSLWAVGVLLDDSVHYLASWYFGLALWCLFVYLINRKFFAHCIYGGLICPS